MYELTVYDKEGKLVLRQEYQAYASAYEDALWYDESGYDYINILKH